MTIARTKLCGKADFTVLTKVLQTKINRLVWEDRRIGQDSSRFESEAKKWIQNDSRATYLAYARGEQERRQQHDIIAFHSLRITMTIAFSYRTSIGLPCLSWL